MWDKPKFLERKTLMSEYYADFKDNGMINGDKFKVFFCYFLNNYKV